MAAKKWKPVSRRSEMTSGRSAPGMFKGNGPNRHVSVKESLRGAGHAKKINDIQGAAGQNRVYSGGTVSGSGAFPDARDCHGRTKY